MKVIVFIAILGLALAGLRGDKRKVPHSIPHRHHAVPHSIPHHQHSSHHATKTSGHGHGSSNSENSEELFNLLGALEGGLDNISGDLQGITDSVAITAPTATATSTSENSEELFNIAAAIQDGIANAIQGTTDAITSDLQGTADTINSDLQGTAATICANAPGLCDDAQGTADTVDGDLVGTDTLGPIINATGLEIAYPTQQLNTTQVQDVNEGVATAETGRKATGYIIHMSDKGLAAASSAFAFVDLQGIIENDIQGTIDTIQGDITGTVDTIQGDLQGTAATVTNAVESITPAEAAATGNAIASTIGTGLKLGNSALKDVNDGLSIANAVIP